MKRLAAIAALVTLGACATPIQEIGRAPALSPVGLGIDSSHDAVPPLFTATQHSGSWA